MRLLHRTKTGALSLVGPFSSISDVPDYAILSHTWGDEDEEVTFNDVQLGQGKEKRGYKKITFCVEQAAEGGLSYCWIDTCCIDRSSPKEVGGSIRRMFEWYRRAAKCYVYLEDVSYSISLGAGVEEAFANSRWFTRGWTLPELVAPKWVEFFTRDGELMGDKITLVSSISSITGIDRHALEGAPLSSFSVGERLSWVENRQTSRPEDRAYCLLGIFDAHISIEYGEGEASAMARLLAKILPSEHTDTDTDMDYLTSSLSLSNDYEEAQN